MKEQEKGLELNCSIDNVRIKYTEITIAKKNRRKIRVIVQRGKKIRQVQNIMLEKE